MRALSFSPVPAVVLLVAAACGATGGDERLPARGPTELAIVVRPSPDAPARRYELACDPPRGSHPAPAEACAVARRAGADAFEPVPPGVVCTQVYGGPETAHVVGFVDGTHVNAGFARRNGCEIARWDRLRPLVPLPSAGPVAAAAQAAKPWPVPVPSWFWLWARWYLGRSEFAVDGPQNPHVRPPSAPRLIAEWAWRRLAVLQGEEPPPLPTTSVPRGAEGREVAALQRALNGARYVAGPADGVFGTKTRYGVLAFEHAHGLEPDGVVDADEYVRILRLRRARARLSRPDDYVYVDLSRQILLDVRRGRVTRVLPVSTGGGYTYTGLDGRRHVAITPQGTFRVFRKVRRSNAKRAERGLGPLDRSPERGDSGCRRRTEESNVLAPLRRSRSNVVAADKLELVIGDDDRAPVEDDDNLRTTTSSIETRDASLRSRQYVRTCDT